MATAAQFNFLDGGERCTNNATYYINLGLTQGGGGPNGVSTPALPSYTKPFFYGVQGNNNGSIWVPNNGFSSVSIFFGARLFLNGQNATPGIQLKNAAGNAQLEIAINANGSVSIMRGATVLATSAINLIFASTVFFLEIAAVISASAGSAAVYLNGNPTPIVSISEIDTANDTTSLPVTSFALIGNNTGPSVYWRDLYCHDGTGPAPFTATLGDVGAEVLPYAANVSVSFTPNGNAANYQNAAQTPPNPTVDYNESNTVGAADVFSVTPLPANVVAVFGVKPFVYGNKTDSGARALQNTLSSAGTSALGASNYLNETPVVYEDMFVNNPATGGPFTPAAVNALNAGYKISA